MAATERITMTMRELDSYKAMQAVADGMLKPWRAAERLGDGNACPGILMPIAKTPGASPRRRRIC